MLLTVARILVTAAALMTMTGCAVLSQKVICSDSVVEVSYGMSASLGNIASKNLEGKSIIVLPLIGIEDGDDSWRWGGGGTDTFGSKGETEIDSFGRMFADQMTSELTHKGVQVMETRGIRAKDAKDSATKVGAFAYVAGTYTKMGGKYYINTKLVRTDDGAVLASVDACYTYKSKR